MRKILYPLALSLQIGLSPLYGQDFEQIQQYIKIEKKLMIPDEAFNQAIQALDLTQAEELYFQNQHSEAIRNIEEQLRTIKKYELELANSQAKAKLSEAFNELGENYFRLSMWETARDHFSKALELDPTNQSAMLNLASIYLKLNNYKEAKSLAEKYLNGGCGNKKAARYIIWFAEKATKK